MNDAPTDSARTTGPSATTQLSSYKCRGQLVTAPILVKGGKSPRNKVDHEAIPNFMPALRMDFPVADPAEIAGLVAGDKVSFDLVEQPDGTYAASNLSRLPADTALSLAPADVENAKGCGDNGSGSDSGKK